MLVSLERSLFQFHCSWQPPLTELTYQTRLGWMKFSQNYGGVVLGWGTIGQQGAFYMTINSDLLLYYKREYKALMLLRAEYANIDRMTDTAIEQSEFYTITGGIMNIGFRYQDPIQIFTYKCTAHNSALRTCYCTKYFYTRPNKVNIRHNRHKPDRRGNRRHSFGYCDGTTLSNTSP